MCAIYLNKIGRLNNATLTWVNNVTLIVCLVISKRQVRQGSSECILSPEAIAPIALTRVACRILERTKLTHLLRKCIGVDKLSLLDKELLLPTKQNVCSTIIGAEPNYRCTYRSQYLFRLFNRGKHHIGSVGNLLNFTEYTNVS